MTECRGNKLLILRGVELGEPRAVDVAEVECVLEACVDLVEVLAVVELDVITDIRGVWLPHVPLAALTYRLEIALPTSHKFSKVSALVSQRPVVYLPRALAYY